jgi:DNA-binding protein H-NS
MKTYSEVQAEIQRLQAQAEKMRNSEKAGVVDRIREAIATYGITAADLGLAVHSGGRKTSAVQSRGAVSVARYRDPKTGKTWTGRGKPPLWLAGKDRTAFEIPGSSAGGDAIAAPQRRAGKKSKLKGVGVPKYRDGTTGKTWTGRGKPPNWILGARNRDDFLIKD